MASRYCNVEPRKGSGGGILITYFGGSGSTIVFLVRPANLKDIPASNIICAVPVAMAVMMDNLRRLGQTT